MKIIHLLLLISLLGCASIVSKSSYPVSIQSQPVGANFTISDYNGIVLHQGVTPETVTLEAEDGYFSRAEYIIKVSLPGYEERVMTLTATMDGWYWGNLLLYPLGGIGFLGMLVFDPATGAMWKLQDHITVNLYHGDSFLNLKEGQLRLMTVDEVPDELVDNLVRIR